MVGQFRLQRSLQDCFGELFQEAVLADNVFRLLVLAQHLINEVLVDSHRFLILLFRWSFTQLLLQLQRVVRNFSTPATSMLSSPYLMSWRRSPCRTKKSCTICCCRPVPKPSSKS